MRYLPATVLVAIICAAHMVLADKAPSKVQEESSSLSVALFSSEMYDEMLEQIFKQLSPKVHPLRGQKGRADQRAAFMAAIREAYPYEQLRVAADEIYARHFSKNERDQIAAFFGSPTGRKYSRLGATLRAEHAEVMGPFVQKRLPAALKKRGLELDD